MEGIVDSLTKYSQRIYEALETAKKYLLRRNQILDEKYDMEQEWSKIVEKQDRCRRLENEILEDQFRYLEETTRDISRLADQLNEFDEREEELLSNGCRRTYMGVDYYVQCVVKE